MRRKLNCLAAWKASELTLKETFHGIVEESWTRCRLWFESHAARPIVVRLPADELVRRRLQSYAVIQALRNQINAIASTMDGLFGAVLFADAEGWLLDAHGDAATLSALSRLGITEGSCILERYIGGTALGSAYSSNTAITFESSHHYLVGMRQWSSAGVPIFSRETNERLGVLGLLLKKTRMVPTVIPLLQAISTALSQVVDVDRDKQMMAQIYRSLLSHIGAHVIHVGSTAEREILHEHHPTPLSPSLREEMANITREGVRPRTEVRLHGKLYIAQVEELTGMNGEPFGHLGTFRDITREETLEQQLINAERQSALTTLAAGIAHEIRNPLTTARGFLQLFETRIQSQRDKEFLHLTIDELDRVTKLVNDFMGLARPDHSKRTIVDLTDVVRSSNQLISAEAALSGVRFITAIDDEVYVWGDENQLKQVILNVVQNALQACDGSDNSVTVRLVAQETIVSLSIEDTGNGMTKEQLERVYEPFFTTKSTGTGMGMVVTKRIVTDLGGSIDIASTEGQGTTVTILLKRAQPSERLDDAQ